MPAGLAFLDEPLQEVAVSVYFLLTQEIKAGGAKDDLAQSNGSPRIKEAAGIVTTGLLLSAG